MDLVAPVAQQKVLEQQRMKKRLKLGDRRLEQLRQDEHRSRRKLGDRRPEQLRLDEHRSRRKLMLKTRDR